MYVNEDKIMNIIRDLDRFKFHLLEAYQKMRAKDYQEDIVINNYHEPKEINGYKYYQFSYAGSLPMNRWTDKDLIDKFKKYILYCTANQYIDADLPFKKAKIFIQHFFCNDVITDLDNYNHKYIIDALRYTKIISDDKWQNISLDIAGYADTFAHIQVYVVSDENKFDFGMFLDQHRYHLVKNPYPHDDEIVKNEKIIKEEKYEDIWSE